MSAAPDQLRSAAYRSAYRTASKASEAMTDASLRRAYADAVADYDNHPTSCERREARMDALQAEMDHRDNYE